MPGFYRDEQWCIRNDYDLDDDDDQLPAPWPLYPCTVAANPRHDFSGKRSSCCRLYLILLQRNALLSQGCVRPGGSQVGNTVMLGDGVSTTITRYRHCPNVVFEYSSTGIKSKVR
jgi:hypothetical protein